MAGLGVPELLFGRSASTVARRDSPCSSDRTRALGQLIDRVDCRGHAAGGWAPAAADCLSRQAYVALRASHRETLANLSITGQLRRFSNQPVPEIVQCGEPFFSTIYTPSRIRRESLCLFLCLPVVRQKTVRTSLAPLARTRDRSAKGMLDAH